MRDLARVPAILERLQLDGWLMYDFRGQNPTALEVLGLQDVHLSRRFFAYVEAGLGSSPKARATLQALTGVSTPTQIRGEKRAGATVRSTGWVVTAGGMMTRTSAFRLVVPPMSLATTTR